METPVPKPHHHHHHQHASHRMEELSLTAFLKDIDWTEPWIMGLLVFHTVITLLTILTRHRGNFQGVLFFSLLLLVYGSEKLNEYAAQNWRYFSRQQYFDSNGMFISVAFSAPLLINCLVLVGQWMWTSGNLMIKLKQRQLRREMSERRSSLSSQEERRHKRSKTE